MARRSSNVGYFLSAVKRFRIALGSFLGFLNLLAGEVFEFIFELILLLSENIFSRGLS
jgi:hypothetical protein